MNLRATSTWSRLSFLVGLLACAPGCGRSGGASELLAHWPFESSAMEADVLELVNDQRAMGANCGGTIFGPAAPLSEDVLLEEAARAHALDMVERDFFSHENPDGDEMADRVDAVGYAWSALGENIAAGQTTPEDVMASWMNSPGHCSNIMNPDFEEVGIGFYEDHWTQVFGKPR